MALNNAINSPILGGLTNITAGNLLVGNGTSQVTSVANVDVEHGGTGASSLTAHGVVLGNGTSAVSVASVGSNGQLFLGSTGADPEFADLTTDLGCGLTATPGAGSLALSVNLTAGAGITLTPSGSNTSIEISASATAMPYTAVTNATTLVAGNGYVANSASGALAFTLPSSANIGDTFVIINGTTNAGFTIAQNASQIIQFLDQSTTSGVLGVFRSSNNPGTGDAGVRVDLVYVGNNKFNAFANGNPDLI
jgi:hypothetical protein